MESNSSQYSLTSQSRFILHTICLLCIMWWDCVGWMFKEAYLDFTALIIIVHPHHLTARTLHAPYATSYGPDDIPESSISLLSWCSVGSSDHAGLAFDPLQIAGGDYSLCYHTNQVQYSVAMCVELCLPQSDNSCKHLLLLIQYPELLSCYCMVCSCEIEAYPTNFRCSYKHGGIWRILEFELYFCAFIITHFRKHVEYIQVILKMISEPYSTVACRRVVECVRVYEKRSVVSCDETCRFDIKSIDDLSC